MQKILTLACVKMFILVSAAACFVSISAPAYAEQPYTFAVLDIREGDVALKQWRGLNDYLSEKRDIMRTLRVPPFDS